MIGPAVLTEAIVSDLFWGFRQWRNQDFRKGGADTFL